MDTVVKIETEFIKLDSMMKLSGAVDTGGMAKQAIQAGSVMVNGQVCTMRGKKMRAGDFFEYQGKKCSLEVANPESGQKEDGSMETAGAERDYADREDKF